MHISQYHLSLKPHSPTTSNDKVDSATITRPRAYSKPTREELKELTTYLAQHNVDELRSLIHLAATQSSETAHVLLKLLHAHSPLQPVLHPTEPHSRQTHHSYDGYFTPADSGEDSEMSGTENTAPPLPPQPQSQPQHCLTSQISFTEPLPPSLVTQTYSPVQIKAPSPAQERRLKRKSVADWDDSHLPSRYAGFSDRSGTTTMTALQHSPSTKRRRAFHGLKEAQPLSTCVNCGREYAPSKSDGLYGCMYHPGILASIDTESLDQGERRVIKTGTWDCCQGSHASPGCLVTQHRDVNLQGYRTGSSNCTDADDNAVMGMRSSFAEAVSARLLAR